MKNIAFFCIPAHGHTNPMLPVARELTRRGHHVRFYSFDEFREKIEKTGAEFIPCDRFLPALNQEQINRLKQVSTTEMTLTDLGTTINMSDFLEEEVHSFPPDVIYTDSVCFWGKLTAKKYRIPMVVSTSTFAFNQFSSQYQKIRPREMMDLLFGMPKVSNALRKMEAYGYHEKSVLNLVQNTNDTDTVVYTSQKVQPYSKTFSSHYTFVGPSVSSDLEPRKEKERPLVYISMGTVINERPDFYLTCIEALKDEAVDVILSCGRSLDPKELGTLPENFKVYPYVDQLEVLSRADVFITHCGMNSFSESLYMAAPMVLYPQTGEQYAVARRAEELGAGVHLKDDSVKGIREAVLKILQNKKYASATLECSRDLRSQGGAGAAADFIESSPHAFTGESDPLKQVNGKIGLWQLAYWTAAMTLLAVFGFVVSWNYAWIIGLAAGILNKSFTDAITKRILTEL